MIDLETVTGALRIMAHMLTFLFVGVVYRDPQAHYRPGVSALAFVIAASSLALAMQQIIYPSPSPRLFETALFVSLAFLVIRAGGNVALLLPRRPWDRSV